MLYTRKMILNIIVLALTSGCGNSHRESESFSTDSSVIKAGSIPITSMANISDDSLLHLLPQPDSMTSSSIQERYTGSLLDEKGNCVHVEFVIVRQINYEIDNDHFILFNLNYDSTDEGVTRSVSIEEDFQVPFQTSKEVTFSHELTLGERCNALQIEELTRYGESEGVEKNVHFYIVNSAGVLKKIFSNVALKTIEADEYDSTSVRTTNHQSMKQLQTSHCGLYDLEVVTWKEVNYDSIYVGMTTFAYAKEESAYVGIKK